MSTTGKGVVRVYVIRGCWKTIGRIGGLFFRRDFRKFWIEKFPVTLASAQEPALEDEW